MEVWIKENSHKHFKLFKTYPFCASSGSVGPKRKEGDLQIPEGAYYINHFNPQSNFYLSLGLNYPNQSDRILSDRKQPGSSIYIHGNCVTIGCIPLGDDHIKELYVLAVEAKNNGQVNIPVHLFPTPLTDENLLLLKNAYHPPAATIAFWNNLKPLYEYFQTNLDLPDYSVDHQGRYQLKL